MVKKIIVTLLMLGGVFQIGHSQQRGCATDQVYQQLKSEHPEIELYEAQLEQSISNFISSSEISHFSKATTNPDTFIYDIPIVIHVIHDYGVENISDNNLIDAVNYWMTVDMGQNYSDTANVITPFKKYIGNPRIHLHLATIDPNGKPTRGIVRHQSYMTYNGSDEAKLDPWPNTSYVNVWFVNVFSGSFAGVAAYAYYPSSGQGIPYYDGVISLASYYNTDKTVPHELGHVFNLEHPWGNNNQPGVACGDDLVDDTPPTKGHVPPIGGNGCVVLADIYDTVCATGYLKHYTVHSIDSIADYPDTANAQNIMDYTYCQLMFTKGQVVRMHAALSAGTAGRNNLWSAANLATTGALASIPDLLPIADFFVDKGVGSASLTTERCFFLCAGDPNVSFQFRNASWNDTVNSVQWTFSNGSAVPASSSKNNVITTFLQPGWATVSVIVTSNTGNDTTTRQPVYVADPNAISTWGYEQDFASSSDHNNWPTFNYYNNNFKWEWVPGTGYNDAGCMRYRSYDYRTSPANKAEPALGDHDDMFTPGFDLTTTNPGGTVNLNFYSAGASIGGNGTPDTLEIYASTNCGEKWSKIISLGSAQMNNVASQSGEFLPLSSQWQAQTIVVPAAYVTAKTFFKFRYRAGDIGNDFYFDKFDISGYTTEVKQVMKDPGTFEVYPNPAHGDFNIAFATGTSGEVKYDIKDVTGKLVYHKETIYPLNVAVQEHVTGSSVPLSGIYFITMVNGGRTTTKKLVVY